MSSEMELRNESFLKMQEQKRSDTLNKPVEVIVFAKRCVYLNNHRVAGGKPYMSEGLPQHSLRTTLGEVLDAFTDEEITAAINDRKFNRELVRNWQSANPYPPKAQP